MKNILFKILLCCSMLAALAPASFAARSDAEQLFAQAAEAYKKGDYDSAIRQNSDILSSGFESSAVHYNLGNSYLRSRQLGKALASYLRAQRMAPGDGDVLANLTYARSLVSTPTAPQEVMYWAKPFERFSFKEIRWVVLGLFAFTASIILLALYLGWGVGKIVFWGVFGSMLMAYFLTGAFYRASEDALRAVCVERIDAKFEPSQQATTYFKLPEGAEVRVLREKDGWSKIERSDGKSGWVATTAVERI